MGKTAAIYVRRSAADERDADGSDRSGWGPVVGTPWDSTSSSENAPTEWGPSRFRQPFSVVGTRGVEPVLEGGFVDTPHHADVWGLGLDPTIRERGAAGGSVETNH